MCVADSITTHYDVIAEKRLASLIPTYTDVHRRTKTYRKAGVADSVRIASAEKGWRHRFVPTYI